MNDFLSWLFGLESFPAGGIERFDLDFILASRAIAALVMTVALVAALVFSVWLYRRRRSVLGRCRWLLTALRVLSILLLVFLLMGPVLTMVARNPLPSTVVLLADNSRSMEIADKRVTEESLEKTARALGLFKAAAPDAREKTLLTADQKRKAAEARRLDIMKAVLSEDGPGLLGRFDGFKLRTYSFGFRSPRPGPDSTEDKAVSEWMASLRATEPETRLGDAIGAVMNDLRGSPVAGIVVLTDGSSNGGADPAETLRRAGKRDIPVYFVAIGEPDAKDLQVSFLAVRDVLFLEDPAPITVKLRHWGYAGREALLTVTDNEGKVVAERNVTLNESGEQTETIKVTPDKAGKTTYAVKVEPFPDELTADNNSKSQDVRVIDSRIRVLWIENHPRWEFRYAKNVMKRDAKRFDPKCLLFESDPRIRDPDKLYIERFPADEKEMFRCHVVVLGDIESARLAEEDIKLLRRFVSEEGGALIFLAGNRFGPEQWKGTELEELLPVRMREHVVRGGAGTEITDPVTVPTRARRTEIGKRHPLLYIADDDAEAEAAWQEDLVLYRLVGAKGAKPGAVVLLETDEEGDSAEPLIVYSRYGSGTVLYIGTDELWRWRYRPGPVTHDRFWGSILQQAALARLLGESRRISLQLSEKEVPVGGRQIVTARILGEDYQPVTDETIAVTVTREGEDGEEETTEINLKSGEEKNGMFEASYCPGAVGRHTVSLKHLDEEVSAVFRAVAPQLEYENPALDKTRLASWAKLTGGNVYDPWALDGLTEEVRAKAGAAVVRTEDELWDAPFWVFLFVLLAGTEWFLRKRNNLA